jgi:hypothetical protein
MKISNDADTKGDIQLPGTAGQNAFHDLGLDVSAISAHREEIKRREFNRNVCVCGHAMNKHSQLSGHTFCHTARMYCPCEDPRPVVEVSDTRYFMTKSRGYGAHHALSTGLSRLHEVGGSSRLLIEPKCFRCGELANPLIPAGFNRDRWLIFQPGPYNGMFCQSCILEFPINHNS